MYVCKVLDENQMCIEWVTSDISFFSFSQQDALVIGQFLVTFFILCCVYAVIVKSIKIS